MDATPRGVLGSGRMRHLTARVPAVIALLAWNWAFWWLLTLTNTPEAFLGGVIVAVAVTAGVLLLGSGFGPQLAPWELLLPGRAVRVLALLGSIVVLDVRAGLRLTRLAWRAHPRISPGMVFVPTRARADAEVAGVGLLTSLVVDNQIVDLDRTHARLLYHCLQVPRGGPVQRGRKINEPVERLLVKDGGHA